MYHERNMRLMAGGHAKNLSDTGNVTTINEIVSKQRQNRINARNVQGPTSTEFNVTTRYDPYTDVSPYAF